MINPKPLNLSADHAIELAGDLLRTLAPLIGDQPSIDDQMLRWAEILSPHTFGLVCMAAVQMTFRDCLTHVSIPDIPPGAVAFDQERAA